MQYEGEEGREWKDWEAGDVGSDDSGMEATLDGEEEDTGTEQKQGLFMWPAGCSEDLWYFSYA